MGFFFWKKRNPFLFLGKEINILSPVDFFFPLRLLGQILRHPLATVSFKVTCQYHS